MLTKLAFKNAGKSFKDYTVYFLTLTLGVCVFYMFNSIYAQQEIMEVTSTTNASMVALREILSIISVFVAIVLGFLIIYANNFFIKKRKKELGVYMTLGMNKRKISTILLLETSIVAVFALGLGLVLGVFGSQFMSLFTAKLFEADLSAYKFVFSLSAALKSLMYFGIIFLVVIIFNTITISKVQLIELLYGSKKNESLKIKNITTSVVIFIVSLLCLGGAYFLILKNGIVEINLIFWSSIALGTIGTILFFLSLSGFLIKAVQQNKKVYYRGLNIFTLRQLNSKINTNFVSVSVVCILLLMVIGIFSCGYSLQNVLSDELRKAVPYDFSFMNYNEENVDKSILENLPVDNDLIDSYAEVKIGIMPSGENHFEDYDVTFPEEYESFKRQPLSFISLSDYNEIREMNKLSKYELPQNQYLILTDNEALEQTVKQFIDKNISIDIGDISLSPNSFEIATLRSGDFASITFVVEDSLMEKTRIQESFLNIQAVDEEAYKIIDENIKEYLEDNGADSVFSYYVGKEQLHESSITTKALVSFLSIYLGIVFMITCAAILAIQQLSEASDNKYRYTLLKKLGVSQKELNKALFRQIFCYFMMPLSLAVVHSAVGLKAANEVIKTFGKVNIISSISATAIFVVVVYGIYFLVTYFGCKNIIAKDAD